MDLEGGRCDLLPSCCHCCTVP